MRAELQIVLEVANDLPSEELPRLLGELEEIRCTALARLSMPKPAAQDDELLDIDTTATKLGVSKDYLYRNHSRFSFTRRMGKRLLFSRLGLEKHMRTAKAS